MCGAIWSTANASYASRSAGSSVVQSIPFAQKYTPMTSFWASSSETFPLASFMATSRKSLHVLMGLEIWLLSTIHPTVPQSLQTECLLPGSQGWLVKTVSRFLKFGIFDRSSSCSRSLATICGMYGPVGTTMSYPLVPAAAASFVIASSFDA